MFLGINSQIYNIDLLQDKFTFYQYNNDSTYMYIYDKSFKKWHVCYEKTNRKNGKTKRSYSFMKDIQVAQSLKKQGFNLLVSNLNSIHK